MAFERPGKAGVELSHQQVAPTPSLVVIESLGKGLSGTENRFELRPLFVEKISFEKNIKFCQVLNFSVYCRGL